MKRTSSILVILVLAGSACANNNASPTTSSTPTPSLTPTKNASIAAEVPQSVATKGTITIATDASYAPDEFIGPDNKTIIGMDVDLGNAIAAVLGLKATFVNVKFDNIIPGMTAGKYDLGMSSFTDNTEREKLVDFVTYFQAGASIFVASGSGNDFKTLDELCGKPVSAERGTTEVDDMNAQDAKCVKEGKPKIQQMLFDDQNGANLAVISGRAVASLADSQVAEYQVKVTNGKVKVTGEYLAPAPYGIAIQRPAKVAAGSAPMTKPVFDALQELFTDGIYTQILNTWGIASGAITAPKINAAAG